MAVQRIVYVGDRGNMQLIIDNLRHFLSSLFYLLELPPT